MPAVSYKVEVQTDSSGNWDGNAVRLPSSTQAEGYGADLESRWTSVRRVRVEPSDDPINYVWMTGAGYFGGNLLPVPLPQNGDSLPRCPACRNGNAMLDTWDTQNQLMRQFCRDCGYKHGYEGEENAKA